MRRAKRRYEPMIFRQHFLPLRQNVSPPCASVYTLIKRLTVNLRSQDRKLRRISLRMIRKLCGKLLFKTVLNIVAAKRVHTIQRLNRFGKVLYYAIDIHFSNRTTCRSHYKWGGPMYRYRRKPLIEKRRKFLLLPGVNHCFCREFRRGVRCEYLPLLCRHVIAVLIADAFKHFGHSFFVNDIGARNIFTVIAARRALTDHQLDGLTLSR